MSDTMAAPLLTAMRELRLNADPGDSQVDEGEILVKGARLRERHKKSSNALKTELIEKVLTPPTTFSSEWLNKLQQ